MANPYDIEDAFAAIEDELIESMIRNMKRHKAEEDVEGIQWEMWQAKQLESLERYKKANRKKFSGRFSDINDQIEELIREANKNGQMEQEIEILEAIKNGFKGFKRSSNTMQAEFFKLNERKLEALINATTNDMQKAETAVLRRADDQYRQVIFNAQVYANTGAGTYEKAVDMATKDFLSRGIDCIEYSNGARHTLKDYADMAIRTASKRAYLQGEGTMRQSWGISTVIMNKRGNPCPKCLPFCGKVLIDDVWSGGSRKDGPYPLMSTAIAAGLYHPRCKDGHTTYFPGISSADDTWTKKELEDIGLKSKEEAKQQYAKRQVEKYDRMAKNSLDKDNKRMYQNRAEQWEEAFIDGGSKDGLIEIKTPLLSHEIADIDYRAEKVTFKDLQIWKKSIGNVTDDEYAIISGMSETGYVRSQNSYKINKAMREGTINKLSEGNQKTISTLKDVIDKNASDRDAVLIRKVDYEYIKGVYDIGSENVEDIVNQLNKKVGETYVEKGFVSTSYKLEKNMNANDKIELDIYAPKGTKMFLTKNREESEIILQAGTRFELEGAVLTDDGKARLLMKVVEEPFENITENVTMKLQADINKMITPYEKKVLDAIPKKEGYFDFAAHGSATNIEYGSRDKVLSAREVARIIKHSETYNGEKIRLLSCSTGSAEDGFAQQLANALGVEVEAPSDVLIVSPNGSYKIGYDGSGKMKTFKPKGRKCYM